MIILIELLIKVMMPMAGLAFDDPTSKWFTLQDRVIFLKLFTYIYFWFYLTFFTFDFCLFLK